MELTPSRCVSTGSRSTVRTYARQVQIRMRWQSVLATILVLSAVQHGEAVEWANAVVRYGTDLPSSPPSLPIRSSARLLQPIGGWLRPERARG